jgi:hypothetical protein
MSHAHVLDGYYDDLIPAIPQLRIEKRALVALVGVMALGTALVLGAPPAVEAYRGYQAEQARVAEALANRAPVEIPAAWRMEPKPLKLDHMFRSKR